VLVKSSSSSTTSPSAIESTNPDDTSGVFSSITRVGFRVLRRTLVAKSSLIIAMMLFGLWHKATLLFLRWGAYHGVPLVLQRLVDGMRTEAADANAETISQHGPFAQLADWRWFWIPPIYALALLFVLIVTLSRGTSTAQLMYGNF
jgi:D-alanyl-lipoteichoic acid acyltransferase DltB (MBOAT superfamily)